MIEKANPIPPGYYWLDLMDELAREQFSWWLRSQIKGDVKQLKTTASGDWVLFEVIKPVTRWDASAKLGLPTIADWGPATSKEQTSSRPDKEKDLLWSGFADAFSISGLGWALVLFYLANRRK